MDLYNQSERYTKYFLEIIKDLKKARPTKDYKELKITNLIWPEEKLPIDLEAVIQIPQIINRFILMESDGKCFEITIDPKNLRIEVIRTFTLPSIKPKMNLEGLTIFPSGQGLLFIYGDRGSNKRASTLFTSFFKSSYKGLNFLKASVDLKNSSFSNRSLPSISLTSLEMSFIF